MKQRVKVAKTEVTLQDNGDNACEEMTLAEQVYRAAALLANHPYHRA